MAEKATVYIEVSGRPNTGKTTIALAIEKALKHFEFDVECDAENVTYANGEELQELSKAAVLNRRAHLHEFIARTRPKVKVVITQRCLSRGEATTSKEKRNGN